MTKALGAHTTVGGGSGATYPMPLCDHHVYCRICGVPLAAFHSRYAKYCGAAPCPSSVGAEKWQCAPGTWEDKAETLCKLLGE
jgi:hypothetical protein